MSKNGWKRSGWLKPQSGVADLYLCTSAVVGLCCVCSLGCKWSISSGVVMCEISRLGRELHCFPSHSDCVQLKEACLGAPFGAIWVVWLARDERSTRAAKDWGHNSLSPSCSKPHQYSNACGLEQSRYCSWKVSKYSVYFYYTQCNKHTAHSSGSSVCECLCQPAQWPPSNIRL